MSDTPRPSPADDGTGDIAIYIRERLESGDWAPGARLPTERALAESFGTTRAAVRKALATLKGEGLISQRVGSGTYASESLGAMRQIGPAQLMEARIAFEPAVIELAVRNAAAVDLARLDECLAAAACAASVEAFEFWDAQLHEAIAESTHNAFMTLVFRLMAEARRNGEWGALKRRTATPQRRLQYQAEHAGIVRALRDRDGARAAALMRAHLLQVRDNLFSE